MRSWEIIAEKLSASGLSRGCSSEIDATGRVLSNRRTDLQGYAAWEIHPVMALHVDQ
jgi:hypothetical protein